VVVGVRGWAPTDPDRFAYAILEHVLGGGTSSRLFQEVRERRGLSYSVYSYRSAFADAGALAVYAGTAPARAAEALDVVHGELDRMAAGGVEARELALAKGHLRGSLTLSLEDPGARMSRIGRAQLVHGEVLPVEEVLARIEAVTPDDVRRVGERVLGNPRVLAVVGPFEASAFREGRVA
jgi:predicted Zn-dependent peptidase